MRVDLVEGEQVLVTTRAKAPAMLTGAAVVLLLALAVASALLGWLAAAHAANNAAALTNSATRISAELLPWVSVLVIIGELILALLVLRLCLLPMLRWRRERVILTNRRLMVRRPRSGGRNVQIPLEWIQWVHTRQSLWQRLFGCGNLECSLSTGKMIRLRAMPNYATLAHLVLEATAQVRRVPTEYREDEKTMREMMP